MHVIGHQHVGMHGAALAHRYLAQLRQVAFVVAAFEKTRLPIVAALDDMLRHVGKIKTWLAGHPENVEEMTPVSPCDRRRSVGDLRFLVQESAL